MEQKPDAYEPDNLLRYHVALSFVDQLEAEGFLASGDKAAMYALIEEKFGIEKSSIFAVYNLLFWPFRVIDTVPQV